VAWFFHCAPSVVLGLSVAAFLEWEWHGHRIAQARAAALER
jgi:hypothetical protein